MISKMEPTDVLSAMVMVQSLSEPGKEIRDLTRGACLIKGVSSSIFISAKYTRCSIPRAELCLGCNSPKEPIILSWHTIAACLLGWKLCKCEGLKLMGST